MLRIGLCSQDMKKQTGRLLSGQGLSSWVIPLPMRIFLSQTISKLSTYVLASLEQTKNEVLDAYDSYDYASVVQSLLNYLTGDCSALYLSIAKDSLYCEKVDSLSRKEVQTVIYTMLTTLSKLLSPILAFTMDEVYQNILYS